ncbi:MAG: TlpA family protein disulfide reductase [Desulfohalobiaceae bacterium]|nr:TlpA family protein disulfide reductase [Desulfohalobiaceae bacterium]
MQRFFRNLLTGFFFLTLSLFAVQALAKQFAAPDFELPTLSGGRVDLEQYKNENPVLLVFWATWCPGCIREVSNINDLVERYEDQGLVTIGVNIGEPAGRVERFKEKYKPDYRLALDHEKQVSRDYMIQGVPTLLVINKQGNITYASYGVNDKLKEAVEDALKG